MWTGADDARLGRILAARSTEDAARLLGRTPDAVRRRARKLGIAASITRAPARAGARWTEGEDALLVLHAGLNPAMLSAMLDRSDQAIAQRLRRLGLRTGCWRSPHHPSPANGGFTPGERTLIDRELRDRGPRAIASLEDRLERPLGPLPSLLGDRSRPAERPDDDGDPEGGLAALRTGTELLGGYAAIRCLSESMPCGSRTNFWEAPLSKS